VVPASQRKSGKPAPPFNPKGDGVFRPVCVDHAGMPVEIAFLPDGGMVERRTVPEAYVEGLKDHAAAERDDNRRGSLLGNTQRHRLKVMEMPAPLYASLARRFGPFKKNKKDWIKWLNNEGQAFLTSQYRLG
jgi:hypothetical protein